MSWRLQLHRDKHVTRSRSFIFAESIDRPAPTCYNPLTRPECTRPASMPIDWSLFAALVQRHRRFLLTCHVRPDGDSLGSMLALAYALEALGKSCKLVVASVIPPRYDFLDPDKKVTRFFLPGDEYKDAEAIIVLDTGTWNQLGDFGTFMKSMNVPKVVIDHHITQDDLGAMRLVDTDSEATGRLVHEAIQVLGVKLEPRMADVLLVAVAMDTGWFRHQNTSARSFSLVAQFVEAGARPTAMYEALFEQNTLGRLKLMGLVLGRLQVVHEGRTCFTEIRKDDYAACGATPQDSEDLINFTRSVIGIEVGLVFMEQPAGGIKISFRARTVDVSRVAEQFNGGGHRLASGAIVQSTLEETKTRVLAAVAAALQ